MIQVRKCRYRNKDGYSVTGYRSKDRSGWPISIWARTEPVARHIAAKVKAGEEIVLSDWDGDE